MISRPLPMGGRDLDGTHNQKWKKRFGLSWNLSIPNPNSRNIIKF